MVFGGILLFFIVCTFAWARPMDFLWFGGIR
jgi:hypothetical protein